MTTGTSRYTNNGGSYARTSVDIETEDSFQGDSPPPSGIRQSWAIASVGDPKKKAYHQACTQGDNNSKTGS